MKLPPVLPPCDAPVIRGPVPLLRECAVVLARVDAALAKECLAAANKYSDRCRRAGQKARPYARGKKIPWAVVRRLRAKGLTWKQVAARLEVSQLIKMNAEHLARRFALYLAAKRPAASPGVPASGGAAQTN